MGLYSTCVFPFFLDLMLDNEAIRRERRETLAPLYGNVLEIGFGTGLNLSCYPQQVTQLTVIDCERMLSGRVRKRIAAARVPVRQMKLDASDRLPFGDNSFDGVATTLTLCSIENVSAALAEIRRVLKTEARYVFLEHGRSRDPQVAKRQDSFNPIQKIIACGCNVNRQIDGLIKNAGLRVTKLDCYSMPGSPRILGEMYRGVAQKQ
jgi:ubiquinone/menaquinone biosynthesis C-methylase UbiE